MLKSVKVTDLCRSNEQHSWTFLHKAQQPGKYMQFIHEEITLKHFLLLWKNNFPQQFWLAFKK